MVPSAAFGGTASFYRECGDAHRGGCAQNTSMAVERGKGKKNKRVKAVSFSQFRVNCPKSGPQTVMTYLGKPITGEVVRTEIAIDAKVRHGKWHFNELVPDAVGRGSNERIDASINFRGKFRKHNRDKADFTLEVTLKGGATVLNPDLPIGPEPIVTEHPIVDFEPEGCHGVQDFHLNLLRPQDR
ncbi:MAG: hypothetical protein WA701_09720 [Solirubrobacterales bacterium]